MTRFNRDYIEPFASPTTDRRRIGPRDGCPASLLWINDPRLAHSAAVIAAYLVLALTEVVPAFVPALFLLVATPLALGTFRGAVRCASP